MSQPALSSAVRAARPDDVPRIHALIVALAAYERSEHLVSYDVERLGGSLFGPDPDAEVLVAEVNGDVVGFALHYRSFSTWEGPGTYLEDLYVEPEHRGSGLGVELLAAVAALTVERGYARLEWAVLDWNAPALSFYARAGAVLLDEWTVHRLSGDALRDLAARQR